MKTIYCIFLCCFCFSCHFQAKNNGMKSNLNISLLFYPSMSKDIRYSIDIVNDSLIIKKQLINNREYREYRGKLTGNQCIKIDKLSSALTHKYDKSNSLIKDGWGCTLSIDNQIYYEENFFSFVQQSKAIGWLPPPEEIKLLINYIVSLSPIPIELYSFS